ncbi:MAG: DUF2147 domain-containing protein [Desulfuromonadaceae bacterium]|nr:DUF2147 domain-containing protein [Desulfuromonadaceae bacterium]MDD2848308.1 DUF2147 domain-containing protein [Desulfuromonadaceae bacterium]MDD4129296.1 DUF2147 domain-containing protein [Desulfuromonadaceae bacterium]
MKILIVATIVLLMATTTFSAGPGDILGSWKTDGGDSWLALFECGDKICATIVWLKEPNYISSKDGPVGETKVDRENPDPALRNRPILGLQVMNGFTAKGNNQWENGTCYNPESGKRYRCKMHLVSPHRLELRGYVGISLFGRTTVLTR